MTRLIYSTTICVLLGAFLWACQSDPKENKNTSNDLSTEETNQNETDDQAKAQMSTDAHPCDALDLEMLAKLIGYKKELMSSEKKTVTSSIVSCTVRSTEFAEEGDTDGDGILYVDKMTQKKDSKFFENQISRTLTKGTMKVAAGLDKDKEVPVREVKELGSGAMVYSAADYTTLMFHIDNKVRYTVTLYRKTKNKMYADGIDKPSEKLEEWVEEIARNL